MNCDLDRLLGKVKIGAVGLGPDWRYYITSGLGDDPIPCDDVVYRAADAGLVNLDPDGPVSQTKAGRRRYEATLAKKRAVRKAAREPQRGGIAAAANVRVAA